MKCLRPFLAKNKQKDEIPVPCGKCPNCLKRRVSGWSFRLRVQEKHSWMSHFITLTYDTRHVPITSFGYMSLNKRDLQLFFKRLRKAHGKQWLPIKYYAVGEYGGKTLRPHYHLLVYNVKIELIQDAWALGSIHYGQVTGASVGYTLKYMNKKPRIPMHQNDDRVKEFSLMSKGLGQDYITPQMKQWHLNDLDNRMYVAIEEGKKISMPRYYKNKIYTDEQRERAAFASGLKAIEELHKYQQEMIKKYGDRWLDVEKERMDNQYKMFQKRAEQDRNKI